MEQHHKYNSLSHSAHAEANMENNKSKTIWYLKNTHLMKFEM